MIGRNKTSDESPQDGEWHGRPWEYFRAADKFKDVYQQSHGKWNEKGNPVRERMFELPVWQKLGEAETEEAIFQKDKTAAEEETTFRNPYQVCDEICPDDHDGCEQW